MWIIPMFATLLFYSHGQELIYKPLCVVTTRTCAGASCVCYKPTQNQQICIYDDYFTSKLCLEDELPTVVKLEDFPSSISSEEDAKRICFKINCNDEEVAEIPCLTFDQNITTDCGRACNTYLEKTICNYLDYNDNSLNITATLNKARSNVTPSGLININNLINNYSTSLTVSQVDIIANILDAAVNQPTRTAQYKAPFLQIINGILGLNRTLLRNTRNYGSTDKILKSADKLLIRLTQESAYKDIEESLPNIAFKIVHPSISNNQYDLTFQNVSVKIPNDILNTSIITIYRNDHLFPEGNVVGDIVDLKILGVNNSLSNPVSFFLQADPSKEVVCSFWKYGEVTNGNWSIDDVETVRISDNLVECKSNHLTAFALLGVSDRIFDQFSESHKLGLTIISTILCFLSLIGLVIILITCFALKGWYKKRINTVQLSCVIICEISMLFLHHFLTIYDGLGCVFFAVLLHYLVLAKFTLMLLIARKQYENFVSVLTSRNKSRSIFSSLICFSVPILIVCISVGLFYKNYTSGNVDFCYPKDEAFKYFVIIPIALILLTNLVVFSMVMLKISQSISRDIRQKVLQAKLAVMLSFMLGLTWLFSVFSHIVSTEWLQLLFTYIFCILSPFQGFVIFVFAVLMDADAKTFWMECYKRVRYSPLERELSNNTTTTVVSMSNVSQSEKTS